VRSGPLPIPSPADRLDGIQAVLFDLDGTLIDTIELIRVSFRHATKAVLGRELPDAVTMSNVGQPLATQFHDMAPDHADELLRVYRTFNHAHHDELAKEYPGTCETLRILRDRGVPMGIVTSKGTTAAVMGIERFGLGEFMSVVVTADDVSKHKPDPFPLEFAAHRLGVELGYCVYLGDSPHDMQSALSANAVAVAALWGGFAREDVLMPGPPFALADIRELPALLDGDVERFAVESEFVREPPQGR
jgi:pyrophosphatase PpaX